MSDPREALEKKLEKFIPESSDEFTRKRVIKLYISACTDEEVLEILNKKRGVYFDWRNGEYIYLP